MKTARILPSPDHPFILSFRECSDPGDRQLPSLSFPLIGLSIFSELGFFFPFFLSPLEVLLQVASRLDAACLFFQYFHFVVPFFFRLEQCYGSFPYSLNTPSSYSFSSTGPIAGSLPSFSQWIDPFPSLFPECALGHGYFFWRTSVSLEHSDSRFSPDFFLPSTRHSFISGMRAAISSLELSIPIACRSDGLIPLFPHWNRVPVPVVNPIGDLAIRVQSHAFCGSPRTVSLSLNAALSFLQRFLDPPFSRSWHVPSSTPLLARWSSSSATSFRSERVDE